MAGLSIRTRFGYGVGHVLNDLCSAMWFTYLLIYFHHVLLFDNSLAGVVLLIGQVADGLSTPFVGREADRTDDMLFCSRYGRRKSWHLLGTICVLSAFPFIFLGCLGCGSSDEWAQVIYYTPFVIIFQFGWAATQISHLALIPSITQDPHDRTDLVAIRYGFTVMANITVYLVTWLVLGIDATSAETGLGPEDGIKFRYIVMAVLAIGIIFVSVFHALVKEDNVPQYSRILPDTEVTCEDESNHTNHLSSSQQNSVSHCAPVHCRMTAIDWLQNMQFYQIAMLYMGTRLFCNLSQAYVPIYIQDSLQLPQDSVAYIPLVMYVSGFLTSTIMKALNKYIGRKASFILGCIIGGGACIAVWFGRGDLYKQYLLYGVAALLGAGGSIMLVTSLSFTADLIGPNVESGAFVYGAMSFTDKISNGAVVMLIQNLNPCTSAPSNCCPRCSSYYQKALAIACGAAAMLGLFAVLSLSNNIGDRQKGNVSDDCAPEHSENIGADEDTQGSTPSYTNSTMYTIACVDPSSAMAAASVGSVRSICDGFGTEKQANTTSDNNQPGSEEYAAVPQGLRARVSSSSSSSDSEDGAGVSVA